MKLDWLMQILTSVLAQHFHLVITNINMSKIKRKNVRRKKKKFLMGVENRWLIEDNLMSVYGHLVESYSEQLREEWKVKDDATSNIKQEGGR